MLKKDELKLINELFYSCYYSYINMNNIKYKDMNINIRKLCSDITDLFYDGLDTSLEILDIYGANK